MPQSLAKNLLHLVYGTKHRKRWIHADTADGLWAYQAGVFKQWDSPALAIGGYEDHVHVLFVLSRNHPLKNIVEEVKKSSSKWIKTQGPEFAAFQWQKGYAAFSASQSSVDEVKSYIEAQPDRHRKMSFQDEFRALLKRHGLEFDECYVWD
ncbi:MAG: transposase [Pirellulales bacterium]|nr:transposase [Pirellulales bacterium]